MSFGSASLWGATLVVVALTLAALYAALRAPDAGAPPRSRASWLIAAGAFALISGAAWLVVDRFATSHAFWDQWEEAVDLYQPFAADRYTWSELFAAHNEHRIALSRLWALLLFEANGVWDNRMVAAANAFVHALPALVSLAMLARKLRPLELFGLALLLVAPAALPLAWENVAFGFQSQFYFLILYATLALWLCAHCAPASAGWWLGLGCALLALFTVGSGLLCAGAVVLAGALEWLRARRLERGRWLTLTCCLGVALLGLATRVEFEPHRALHPDSFGQLIEATLCFAGFPFRELPAMAFVVWAPTLLWGIGLLRQRRAWTGDERFLAAASLFVLLHAPAIAWARGGASFEPSSRYFDILALGLVVNAAAAVVLLRRRAGALRVALLALWLGGVGWGVQDRAVESIERELPGVAARGQEQQRRLHAYLQTGDPEQLRVTTQVHLPYPNAVRLRAWLDDAYVRSILPASLTAAVPPVLGQRPDGPLAVGGTTLLIGGAACWGGAAVLLWRRRRSAG